MNEKGEHQVDLDWPGQWAGAGPIVGDSRTAESDPKSQKGPPG
jgi:hypothetical protein